MKATLWGLSTLAVCAGFMAPAAADDNVFHPACFFRPRTTTSTSGYAPQVTVQYPPALAVADPCNTCPQATCTTRYLQQSYYQAVTAYQSQTYYEPVTTYQTQSYYEPVTVMRSSLYWCPNSCSWKQTCTPETSYQLRTKSCPVQSYVAKCVQVPVTTYQKAYYYTPQTVCSQSPPPCCPTAPPCCPTAPPCCPTAACPTCPTAPQTARGTNPAGSSGGMAPPIINDPNTSLSPPIIKDRGPNGNGSSWQPGTGSPIAAPVTPPPSPASPPPAPAPQTQMVATTVTLNRIVLGGDATVEGDLVHGDNTPRPDAKILFVNVNQQNLRQTATTNKAGRFQITLATGGWLIYLYNRDGEAIYHSRIEVADDQSSGRIVLVNR